jgi:Fe-S cluster assembly iron-binding protein IscA
MSTKNPALRFVNYSSRLPTPATASRLTAAPKNIPICPLALLLSKEIYATDLTCEARPFSGVDSKGISLSGKRLEEVAVMSGTTGGYGTRPVIHPRSSAVPQASRLMALEIEGRLYPRPGIVTSGCSGLPRVTTFHFNRCDIDRAFDFNGLKVPVDLTALIYLPGNTLDFRDGLSDAFAFHNPQGRHLSGSVTVVAEGSKWKVSRDA